MEKIYRKCDKENEWHYEVFSSVKEEVQIKEQECLRENAWIVKWEVKIQRQGKENLE